MSPTGLLTRIILISGLVSVITLVPGCNAGKAKGKKIPVSISAPNPYEITRFSFKAANNPSLASDIDATIETNTTIDEWLNGYRGTITAWVPYGTDIMNLVADYKTSGKFISVNGIVQENGKTHNDFSNTLAYRVHATDEDYKSYLVEINESPRNGKEITAFMFRSEKNPSLVVDYIADITGTQITVTLTSSADPSSLVASFASTGSRITVNGVEQKSGVTVNDFSGTVMYTVEAADGTTRDYSVSVETSGDTAKEITSFSLTSSANPTLADNVEGTIAGTEISLSVTCNIDTAHLVPSFAVSGGTVTVSGTDQVSGFTANDFSAEVYYRVTAGDGTYIDYRVTVTLTHYLRWATTFGGKNETYNNYWSSGAAITRDSLDNLYVAGYIEGTADLDPGPGVENAGPGVLIMKLDNAGNRTWARVITGYSIYPNISVKGIAIDAGGNVFITGNFEYTVDFDPGAGVDNHTAVSSYTDVYVTRLNSDGTYGWTRTFGTQSQYVRAMTIDPGGNVIVGGSFRGTVDFDPSGLVDNHTSQGGDDIFVTKITSAGDYAWTRSIGGTGNDCVNAIAADGSGGICLTGYFDNSVDFDPGPSEDIRKAVVDTSDNMYVTKLTSDGSYGWTCTDSKWTGRWGQAIYVDADSNVYVAASIWYDDMFIVKINAGGTKSWDRSITPVHLNSNGLYPYGMSGDTKGHIYICGFYSGTVDFDPSARIDSRKALDSNSGFGYDMFIMQLHGADGSYGSTLTLQSTRDDEANAVTVDSQGYVYLIGGFGDPIDVDPSGRTDIRTPAGDHDIIVAGYRFP